MYRWPLHLRRWSMPWPDAQLLSNSLFSHERRSLSCFHSKVWLGWIAWPFMWQKDWYLAIKDSQRPLWNVVFCIACLRQHQFHMGVWKLATLPNTAIFLGKMIHSPADFFFLPHHLQRNPAGVQMETRWHEGRFCAAASAPMAPWLALSRNLVYLHLPHPQYVALFMVKTMITHRI